MQTTWHRFEDEDIDAADPYAVVEPELTYRQQYGTDPIPAGKVMETFERILAELKGGAL